MHLIFYILSIHVVAVSRSLKIDYEHCMCVPFWKCRADLTGLLKNNETRTNNVWLQAVPVDKRHREVCKGQFDVCCQAECGTRPINLLKPKILGVNNEVGFGEFPWMLGLIEESTYKCGGALIHPKVGITAAHCVDGPGPYFIRAGEWDWNSETERLSHQDRVVSMVILHERYQRSSLKNDVALVVVEEPFRLDEHISLACIPFQEEMYDGFNCMVSGWGKNSPTALDFEPTLKKTHLPIVPRVQCLGVLEKYLGPAFQLDPSFLCAGAQSLEDTCKGDGGSPLVCPSFRYLDRYVQVGIVSWGLTCGLFDAPGVFVEVAQYSDWIDKQMLLHTFDIDMYRY